MGRGDRRADLAPAIGKEAEWPGGGDRRIQLAQRAGGGVARVGEDLAAGLSLPLVERGEVGAGHVDLAAHLADRRSAGDPVRDIRQRAQVGGHVLAGVTVAAGGADRRIGPPRSAARSTARRSSARPSSPGQAPGSSRSSRRKRRTPSTNSTSSASAKAFAKRQHRPRVLDLGESRSPPARPPCVTGESARTSSGKRASIAALRWRSASYSASLTIGRIPLIVGAVVPDDLDGERRQFFGRLLRRQILDGEQAQPTVHAS